VRCWYNWATDLGSNRGKEKGEEVEKKKGTDNSRNRMKKPFLEAQKERLVDSLKPQKIRKRK